MNATLSSTSITEPPVNDFQEFVTDMQKTITSLRKQVRLDTRLKVKGVFEMKKIST